MFFVLYLSFNFIITHVLLPEYPAASSHICIIHLYCIQHYVSAHVSDPQSTALWTMVPCLCFFFHVSGHVHLDLVRGCFRDYHSSAHLVENLKIEAQCTLRRRRNRHSRDGGPTLVVCGESTTCVRARMRGHNCQLC